MTSSEHIMQNNSPLDEDKGNLDLFLQLRQQNFSQKNPESQNQVGLQEGNILAQRGLDRFSFQKQLEQENRVLEPVNFKRPRGAPRRIRGTATSRKLPKNSNADSKRSNGLSVPCLEEDVGFDRNINLELKDTQFEQERAGYEKYFEQTYQGAGKNLTSDNTLAQLQSLEPQNLTDGAVQAKARLAPAIIFLNSLNGTIFSQFQFELEQGFNLIFYGYGSKKATLEKFARETLLENTELRTKVLVVNGYFPDLTLRSIILQLTRDALKIKSKVNPSRPMEVISQLSEYFESPTREVDRLYVLIHNLDGENLRSEQAQQFIVGLCRIPKVSLVCSIDHQRSPLLWDRAALTGLNFLWHEMATFQLYEAETAFESSPLIPLNTQYHGSRISIRGVSHVLESVGKKSKGLLKILLESQIKQLNSSEGSESSSQPNANPIQNNRLFSQSSHNASSASNYLPNPGDVELGLTLDQLYSLGRQKFLVSSMPALDANLREFLDHGIVKTEPGSGSRYFVSMPMSGLRAILKLLE